MKTILFPTDFSKNAIHAAEYAGILAKKFHAKVILLHVFSVPMVPATNMSSHAQFAIDNYRNNVVEELDQFSEKFIKASSVDQEDIILKIEYGFPAEKILEIANSSKVDMIVMGTKGASNFLDKWLGTNSQKVIKEAECPVWVIPQNTRIEYPENVLYAADYREDEFLALQKLLWLTEPLKATCRVVHINDFFELSLSSPSYDMIHALNDEFEEENISFQNINSEGILVGLEDYISKNKPNLLVLAVHEKSFWSKILDTSITKHFVQEAKLPLLIFKK